MKRLKVPFEQLPVLPSRTPLQLANMPGYAIYKRNGFNKMEIPRSASRI